MSLTVLGVDPGLEHVALCRVTFGRELEAVPISLTIGDDAIASDVIVAEILEELGGAVVGTELVASDREIAGVAIEDFVWRPAKVHNGRQITTGLAMARMLGRVEERLRPFRSLPPIHWVRPQDSLREQPFGARAKKLGIPGRNNHERSAFYQARWLLGTLRMGGAGRTR